MARSAGPCVGVDLGTDSARLVVVAGKHGVVDARQILGPPTAREVAEACAVLSARCRTTPSAIGLAARSLPPAEASALGCSVAAATGLPCAVAGVGTCALLALFAGGDLRGDRDVALISLGDGLHAGIWLDGKPLHRHGGDPDVAHFPLDPAGERCRCGGRGCAHTVLGPAALARTAALAQLPASAGQAGGDLAGRAEAGDPMARAVLQRMADDAFGLARGLLAAFGTRTLALHWPTAAEKGVVADLLRATAVRQLPHLTGLHVATLRTDSVAEGAALWAMRRTR